MTLPETADVADPFADFPTEDDVRESWTDATAPPLASLVSVSYQHAGYVVAALRGMVEQRTDFPFEILCYDDCSTDGTREILIEFSRRYPTLVTLVLPETNQFSAGRKPFFDRVVPLCRGRFIARIESDDHWCDPTKIQKQVAFLLDNDDYVLVTHDVSAIDERGEMVRRDWLVDFWKRDFTAEELTLGWGVPLTSSVLFRNVIDTIPDEMRKTPSGDTFLGSMLGRHGKGKYLADIAPSMYRLHGGGVFSPLSESDKLDVQILAQLWLYRYHKRVGSPREARFFKLRYLERSLRDVSFLDVLRLLRLRFTGASAKTVLEPRD